MIETTMLRLGIVCDLVEERWPSMDLVAEMLCTQLRRFHVQAVQAARICPRLIPRFERLPVLKGRRIAFNADRLLNRFWDYPRHLRARLSDFDCFHICDHSYAHLTHELPAKRTGVFCHDLDCFRCLLDPRSEPRPRWFRAMTRRILCGLQKASAVFYSTAGMGRRLLQSRLLDPDRLVYAPYGVSPEFHPGPDDLDSLSRVAIGCHDTPFVLHVGSCIPRKRIDVLLHVFAAVKARFPELMLVQVGGEWTAAQREQIEGLGIERAVRQLRGLDRRTLAALYRRARVVLQPSEAEGFGLPVLEALACAALVVASDIAVLREVGGDGAVYCPVADLSCWAETIERLLTRSQEAPDPAQRLARAQRFSWRQHAHTILQAYAKN